MNQVPLVAVEIFEHCDGAVFLVSWFFDEDHALQRPFAIGGVEVVGAQEKAHGAARLVAYRGIIFKLIGSSNQVEAIIANIENRVPQFNDVG